MGKVIAAKGNAIFIPENGGRKKLTQGAQINGNGIVATNKASFIRIEFDDGSLIALGPSSQINVGQKIESKPKVIELIKGQIRATVSEYSKVPPEGHKMYIKTRTAAMGVRGTDFIVTHNPKNHVTSTLAFRGEVHLYKRKDEIIHESLREDFDAKTKRRIDQQQDVVGLEDELRQHKTVAIKAGKVSGAFPSYEKAQAPVKISPVQLAILAQNTNMDLGRKGKVVDGSLLSSKKLGPSNEELVPSPPGEESIPLLAEDQDAKSADGVRAGGNIDLATGFYLPPPEDAKYDKTSGTFVMPKDYGGVNSQTGEYVPPKGMRLDALHGFVPMLGMGPEYKDHNFKKSLAKFKHLKGSMGEKLSSGLRVFKELSRFDFFSYLNYRLTTNAMENYYGEWRAITNLPTMILDWKIQGGFQAYHSRQWLLYPKAHLFSIYHERDLSAIKRNDMIEMMFGFELHRTHYLMNRKARFVADVEFKTEYLDYQKRQQYDYYTEDAGLKLSERFQFSRTQLTELYYQIRAFQGYFKANHGNIHNVGATHRISLGKQLDFQINYEHGTRKEQWTGNRFKIDRLGGQLVFVDLLPKLDLTTGYTWEWLYYQYERDTLLAYRSDPNLPDENMKKGLFYRINLLLNRRLGDFWKVNGLYEFSRQRTSYGGRNKAFIQQTWGGGLTMVF